MRFGGIKNKRPNIYSAFFVFGGGRPIVVEHPVIVKRSHSVQWKREVFDLDQKKLATLKSSQWWTNAELAHHFGVSISTIKVYLYDYDRTGNKKGAHHG
jgi:hypothetical protein